MVQFRGRHEVKRRRDRLSATVVLIDGASLSGELLAHYARYLTVLVSGYVEQSSKELVREYSRNHGDERVQRFVGKQVERFRNIDGEKLKQLLDALDPSWWNELELAHADDLEALKSVATVRNNVSHGGDSGITVVTAKGYLDRIERVVVWLTNKLDPPPLSA
jgi:hypothetical protein